MTRATGLLPPLPPFHSRTTHSLSCFTSFASPSCSRLGPRLPRFNHNKRNHRRITDKPWLSITTEQQIQLVTDLQMYSMVCRVVLNRPMISCRVRRVRRIRRGRRVRRIVRVRRVRRSTRAMLARIMVVRRV